MAAERGSDRSTRRCGCREGAIGAYLALGVASLLLLVLQPRFSQLPEVLGGILGAVVCGAGLGKLIGLRNRMDRS